MHLAERSGKSAVEDQQDILFALKIRKTDFVPIDINEGEIGSGLIEFDTVAHVVNQYLCNVCCYCSIQLCVCSLSHSEMGLPCPLIFLSTACK